MPELKEYGVATRRMRGARMLQTSERVRFVIPTGHTIELYAEKTDVGNGRPYLNPEPWLPNLPGIAPVRFDHAQAAAASTSTVAASCSRTSSTSRWSSAC